MNLFLVPAHKDNIDKSIAKRVPWDLLEEQLPSRIAELKECYRDSDPVHCWAMTENKKSVFSRMQPGDLVLITEEGTGKFNYGGVIVLTMECAPGFGNALWAFTSNKPWTLVFFLKDVVQIDIEKRRLVTALGYDPNYWVPGVLRVRPEGLKKLTRSYGSIAEAIEAIQSCP
jgi:hypothetical protein